MLIQRQRTATMIWAGALASACRSWCRPWRPLSLIPGEIYGAMVLIASTFVDAAALQLVARAGATGHGPTTTWSQLCRDPAFYPRRSAPTWATAASRTVIDAGLARTASGLAAFSLAHKLRLRLQRRS